jgi:hypothetical protein
MGEPPALFAVKEIVMFGLEPYAILVTFVAVPIVGADGTEETLAATPVEANELPRALVATTVYVYVPAPDSVITTGDDAPVFITPLEEVTVNKVIAEPPVAPAVKATLACGAFTG